MARIVFYWAMSQNGIQGCRFYDKNQNILLEFGSNFDEKSYEIALADEERVIGVKSRLLDKKKRTRHLDFQFIIGRMQ